MSRSENTTAVDSNAATAIVVANTVAPGGPGLWALIGTYVVFFLSGSAALIYEISWSRQIGLLFGHTVHAASVVLASYFAGMAIGYTLGGRLSSRVSPLHGYAIAELVAGGWACMIPFLLGLSETSPIARLLVHSSNELQTATRALFCFLLLLPATVALGVTLPMMAAFLSNDGELHHNSHRARSRVTLAYAINTAGAMAGVISATFWLLIVVGVRNSSYLAAGLSMICAGAAWMISKGQPTVKHSSLDTHGNSYVAIAICKSGNRPMAPTGLAMLATISGFGTLALQVLYTRMFSLVFHNSTYTFGIIVAVFLAALALGAGLASRLQFWVTTRKLIGLTTGLGAVATVTSVFVFVWQTELKYFDYGDSFQQYMGGAILLVAAVVAPPIICLGMILPLLWSMARQSERAGSVVGKLTAINTIASATGALAASFCMLTWVGLWQSMALISFLFFLVSVALLWQENQKWMVGIIGLSLATASLFALRSPIEAEFDRTRYGEHLVRRWNSPYGWIDVVRREETGAFKIRQNLHYRFGTTGDNAREYRQAHIPLLLHGHPSEVLFLGLGTGLTAGGAVPHTNVEKIVAVELIPQVIDAARYLANYNHNVVDHPKVQIQTDDARHYLLASQRQFDVIVSDLFVPWESESGYLYTVEHYQCAMKRLKPDGLFCQWLPLYQLGPVEFESIANSFASVFPNTTIWWSQLESASPVIALVGTLSPLEINADELDRQIAELGHQLENVDPNIESVDQFCDLYIGDWELTAGTNLNTDEHPRVEFLAPISNRDGKLIRGEQLERYYDEVLSKLPIGSVRSNSRSHESADAQRRNRQRFILFGK